MSFCHTYVLRFLCSFPQVGRRVSIVHAHYYAHVMYMQAHRYVRTSYVRVDMETCACVENWTWTAFISRNSISNDTHRYTRSVYISSRDRRTALFELYWDMIRFICFVVRTDGKSSYVNEA